MDKFTAAKKVTCFIVGLGVSKISKEIIQNNVTVDTKLQKALVWVGAVAIGWAASDFIEHKTEDKIDEIATDIKKAIAESKKTATPIL